MPNPQFTKPWRGIPREQIHWNPTVHDEACIGCGTCVTGCNRLVYRFDYERKKPVVVDPLNCMVGCTTCANTCPAHAIEFPPIESILALEQRADVHHATEDDLIARRDVLAWPGHVPHPDRLLTLRVEALEDVAPDVRRVVLAPAREGDCFCEFVPGQYLELFPPAADRVSRAYSVANLAAGDGRVELHVRRVEGGRFTAWVFGDMKVGDTLQARGPLGAFTMRSAPGVPLLFVAGGVGFAPVHALIAQQLRQDPERDMRLVWGVADASQFYALDEIDALVGRARALRVVLAAQSGLPPAAPTRAAVVGTVIDALAADRTAWAGRDVYAAGPPPMLRRLAAFFAAERIAPSRLHFDAYGT
ncbi:FAD-binding oxidoreductase [Azohydromonas sediminis]|uniref:FAD-binding oxidoreductase n=1 Tax=Azohydromonas sediminis TaxID=2259674 RepID=UPI000E65E036|nr:FAD-binding oxidoreductase [Azohydromonas sediminis]